MHVWKKLPAHEEEELSCSISYLATSSPLLPTDPHKMTFYSRKILFEYTMYKHSVYIYMLRYTCIEVKRYCVYLYEKGVVFCVEKFT